MSGPAAPGPRAERADARRGHLGPARRSGVAVLAAASSLGGSDVRVRGGELDTNRRAPMAHRHVREPIGYRIRRTRTERSRYARQPTHDQQSTPQPGCCGPSMRGTTEVGLPSSLGAVAGYGVYGLMRGAFGGVPVAAGCCGPGVTTYGKLSEFVPASVASAWWQVALSVKAVTVLGVLVGVAANRGVVVSPLGITRRTNSDPPHPWATAPHRGWHRVRHDRARPLTDLYVPRRRRTPNRDSAHRSRGDRPGPVDGVHRQAPSDSWRAVPRSWSATSSKRKRRATAPTTGPHSAWSESRSCWRFSR